jgi:hypothetical protein
MSIEVYLEDMERYLSKLDYQRYLVYKKISWRVGEEFSQGKAPPKGYGEIEKRRDEMIEEVKIRKMRALREAEIKARARIAKELEEAKAKAYEIGKGEFSQYQLNVHSSISQLKKGLSHSKEDNIYRFLASHVSGLSKLISFEPWNWCQLKPEDIEGLRSQVSELIRAEFERRIPEELSRYLIWKGEWWHFLLPGRSSYIFQKSACLQWVFGLHIVAGVEVWQKAGEYSIKFQDFPFVLSLKDKLLGKFLAYIPPHEFDLDLILTVPLKLLSGLFLGEIEPKGTRILEQSDLLITYEVDGLKSPITLHQEFIDFVRKMREREQPLWETLQHYQLIDSVTTQIIANKVASVTGEVTKAKVLPLPEPVAEVFGALVGMDIPRDDARAACGAIQESNFDLPLEDRIKLALRYLQPKEGIVEEPTPLGGTTKEAITGRVSRKDKKYLRKTSKTSSFLSYTEWGKVLGLSKTGSLRTLHRLEQMGLIHLEKYPTGEGFKATLTPKGEEKLAAK